MNVKEVRKKTTHAATIVSWNIRGAKSKQNDFWTYLNKFDIICISETWMESVDNRNLINFNANYRWIHKLAERKEKKGRASGGISVGIKQSIEILETYVGETIVWVKIVIGAEKIQLGAGYFGDIVKTIQEIDQRKHLYRQENTYHSHWRFQC